LLGSGWRRFVEGTWGRWVGGPDLERAGTHNLEPARCAHRRLEQLNPPAGTDDLGVDGKLSQWDRPQKLVGDAADPESLSGRQLLERAHQERGWSAAMLRSRVPGPSRELACDE
jgi:hypothetical protein